MNEIDNEDHMEKIGIISNYIPEEIIEIFGQPYRIMGNFGNYPDTRISSLSCSFVKDFIIAYNSGFFNCLSGIVMPQSCDSLYVSYELLEHKNKFAYRFSQPIKSGNESEIYYLNEINRLVTFLESQTKSTYSDDTLNSIIHSSNQVKNLLKKCGYLISKQNKNIRYSQFLSLIQMAMQNNFREIQNTIEEKLLMYEKYPSTDQIKRKIMLVGPLIDNFQIIDIIEKFPDTKIVYDNITNGWRYIENEIENNVSPKKAIAKYYLNKTQSPTFDSDNLYFSTFDYAIDNLNINCMIMIVTRGCEPYYYYIPKIQQYCKKRNIPILILTVDHNENSFEKIKIKIFTFLEMI